MIRERVERSAERGQVEGGRVDTRADESPLLTTDDLDAVRHLVLSNLDAGIASWSIDDFARRAAIGVDALRARFGQTERIIDEVVAGELRRARPVVTHVVEGADVATVLISELVHGRLLVEERIRHIWHLIGQGEASSQEFDALRSTLRADVAIRIENRINRLGPQDRIEAVRIIDGALNLAAVRSMRRDGNASVDEVVAHLHSHLEELLDGFAGGGSAQKSARLIIVERDDVEPSDEIR